MAAERQPDERRRLRAGREHDVLGRDVHRALGGIDSAALRVGKHRPALHNPHLGAVEETADALVQPVDDAVLPLDYAPEIETRLRIEGDAERIAADRIGDIRVTIGGVDHRLRRDAAADEPCAAEPVFFDEHGVEAELAGADRRDIASHAAADDQHARTQDFSHALNDPLTNPALALSAIWDKNVIPNADSTHISRNGQRAVLGFL